MNHKILFKLETIIHDNPELLGDKILLEKTINYEFGVHV